MRLILKKADDNKGMKNYPACKELNIMTCGIRHDLCLVNRNNVKDAQTD